MKKITSTTPYFDEQGNLYIPNDIKFGRELNPKLRPREWFFLLLTITDKSKLSPERQSKIFKSFVGSKSTLYRIKKALINKGYLK